MKKTLPSKDALAKPRPKTIPAPPSEIAPVRSGIYDHSAMDPVERTSWTNLLMSTRPEAGAASYRVPEYIMSGAYSDLDKLYNAYREYGVNPKAFDAHPEMSQYLGTLHQKYGSIPPIRPNGPVKR